VLAQRHVIAPFISFLYLYGGFIQGVSNKRVMEIFWKSAPKFHSNWEFLLSRSVVKVGWQQLNIDTNILDQVGLEFDADSKNRIKNYVWFVAQHVWVRLW